MLGTIRTQRWIIVVLLLLAGQAGTAAASVEVPCPRSQAGEHAVAPDADSGSEHVLRAQRHAAVDHAHLPPVSDEPAAVRAAVPGCGAGALPAATVALEAPLPVADRIAAPADRARADIFAIGFFRPPRTS
jgi:hypothetical protein